MGVKVVCTRAALRTTTGTQDFTVSGLGAADEIKAAIFITCGATVNATQTADSNMSYGFADGTNQVVVSGTSEDGVASSDSKKIGATDEVIQMINAGAGGGGSLDMEANFDSFITDGVRINVTNAGTAWLCTVIIFAGTSVSAQVGTQGIPEDTTVGTLFEQSVPFQVETIFGLAYNETSFSDSIVSGTLLGAHFSFGLWSSDNTPNASNYNCYDQDEVTTTSSSHRQEDSWLNTQLRGVPGTIHASYNISDVFSNAFSINVSNSPQARDESIGYLALNFSGLLTTDAQENITAPTATGDFDITAPGFMPQFALQMMSSSELGAGFFLSCMDGTNEFCSGMDAETGAASSNTISRSDSKAVIVTDANDNVRFEATFSSFLSTGYRNNYTTVTTTSDDIILWAIEEAPAVEYEQENFRWRDDDGSESAATFLAAEEVNITRVKSTNTRLRTTIDSTGADPATATATLQYIQKGDNPSEWRDVPLT